LKIAKIQIKNYRSLFAAKQEQTVSLELAEGMNALVGINNTGKSNLLRAVALALDPDHPFDRERDMPGPLMYAFPRVTLEFACEGRTAPERTLLKRADEYERSLLKTGKKTYAQDGIVRFTVSFPGNERFGATRQETIGIRGSGARQGDPEKLERAVWQFRRTLRFVMIESGQSLEGVLAGKFREILRSVIREHQRDAFETAENKRSDFVEGLQSDLLSPLRTRIESIVSDLFPEITGVALQPDVADIESILSNVGVELLDSVQTPLADKGTGVRGAVLVAMLRYLADQSRRSMVFAVEEPEAFLHPAAQEDLRDDLERLAERRDVTLLVSTHSPFVLSRDSKARLFSLVKDSEGRTRIAGVAAGDAGHAPLLGGLFRDAIVSQILDRTAEIPSTAAAIVLVEGLTDADYLRLAAKFSGRRDLIQDLHIVAAGGASKLVLEATVMRARTSLPVLVVLDSDEAGRSAAKTLVEKLGFQKGQRVMTYSAVFDGNPQGVEAEDLFPNALLRRFLGEFGEDAVLSEKKQSTELGKWHFGLNATGKDLVAAFLEKNAKAKDFEKWVELLGLIRSGAGLQ
jgi:hypothetical protein